MGLGQPQADHRLDQLASRPGHQLTHSVGWDLGARERAAIRLVPQEAWQIAIDQRGEVRERRIDEAMATAWRLSKPEGTAARSALERPAWGY